MMEVLTIILLLIAGFYLLIKGADFLVKGASSLAKRLGVSEIIIGLTLVAFGTSLPEAFVNVFASINSQNDIVFGNIIGSNIFNIAVIFGIAGLVHPLLFNKNTLTKEIPFSLFAALLLFLLANNFLFLGAQNNMLSRIDGFIFMVFFCVFLFYVFKISKAKSKIKPDVQLLSAPKIIFYILAGFVVLFIGAKLVVDNSVSIARIMGVSEKLIALTIISAGTSLPELATSVIAAYKKEYDLSIGNIVGSNIFNIFFILGIGALIRPAAYSTVFNVDILVLVVVTAFLFIAPYIRKDKKLHRFESFIFLMMYIGYLAYLFYRK